jgi:hypothetical protein
MSTWVRYDKDLLNTILIRDGAMLVGDYNKINRDSKINFICKCGREGCKTFRRSEGCGMLCKSCTEKKRKPKVKATNLERYGAECSLQNQVVKEKIKATNLERLGVEYPSQSEEVRVKIKETNLERYGVDNVFQSETVKEKIKATNIERLDVEYPTQSEEVRVKIKATNLERYAVENPSQSEDVKEKKKATCLERYGVEHPTQHPEIFEKAISNSKKFKEYKMPSGEIRKVQGFEPFALDELLKTYTEDQIKTDRKNVGRIPYKLDSKQKYYFPDIAIPHENKIIEVKSTWTYNIKPKLIKSKAEATKAKGFVYEIWIFDSKGNRVNMEDLQC